MSNRSAVGLVSIIAGFISLSRGFSGLIQKTVPHLARVRTERLTSIDDNVYTSVQKDETKNTCPYNIYWFAVGGGFASIAFGLVLTANRGHYFDFNVTKAPRSSKSREVEYRDYPTIKPEELDEHGRYKL